MSCSTLMVHLQPGQQNAALLKLAGGLAQRFHARVIGIAACQPMQIMYSDGYIQGDVIEQDRQERIAEINVAEAEFRDALATGASSLEWRSIVTFGPLSAYLADQARGADLIVTGLDRTASILDTSRHVDISDLVMQAGRPVLIVPSTADKLELARVVIGWKDTRETRRAVCDALPLLRAAGRVSVVEIAAEDDLAAAREHVSDVVAWLGRQGILGAEAVAVPSSGNDSDQLNAIARDQSADLIVAGAYGHSRWREWALGGVTRDLLLHAERCSLVSH